MDRNISYAGQVLFDKDMLHTNKFGYVAMSRIFDAIVGKDTVFNRLDCVPATVPNLTVDIETGEIYFTEETDSTPYGVLPVDTTEIVKQGIFAAKTNFPTPAPVSGGNSINYLIEFKFQSSDTDFQSRPYFNSELPNNPINESNFNFRSDECLAQIITGVEAPTGTQATPSVTAGWVGAWVITVNFGDTAVNASAISKYPGALFIEERLLDLAEVSPAAQDNVIIGGNFDTNPWQRSEAATSIIAAQQAAGEGIYFFGPDRFGLANDGTALTGEMDATKVLNAPNISTDGADIFSRHSLEFEVTTAQVSIPADKALTCIYSIEGFDWSQLADKNFVYKIGVYTNKIGKYSLRFQNQVADQSFTHPFVVTSSNTWQFIDLPLPAAPLTGTWDYESGRGLTIDIFLAAGSNNFGTDFDSWETTPFNIPLDQVNFLDAVGNKFAIQLVKLETGTVSTPWKPEKISESVNALERYAEKSYPIAVSPGSITTDFITLTQTVTGNQVHNIQLKTRKKPSVSHIAHVYSPTSGTIDNVDVNGVPTAATAISADETQLRFTVNTTAGNVITFAYFVDAEIR